MVLIYTDLMPSNYVHLKESNDLTVVSTSTTQDSECLAEVLFNFTAENPIELTIHVCTIRPFFFKLIHDHKSSLL